MICYPLEISMLEFACFLGRLKSRRHGAAGMGSVPSWARPGKHLCIQSVFTSSSQPIYWYGVMMAAAFLAAIAHWAW